VIFLTTQQLNRQKWTGRTMHDETYGTR
jgi:hypothetical protein